MKLYRIFLGGIFFVALYLVGIYFIQGTLNLEATIQQIITIDEVTGTKVDQSIAVAIIVLFILLASPFVNTLIRNAKWLGVILVIGGASASAALIVDILSFSDRRLLALTSALLAASIVCILCLSLIAVLNMREFEARGHQIPKLHKLSIKNPAVALLQTSRRTNQIFLSVTFVMTYIAFTYFYALYTQTSVVATFDLQIYTLVYGVAVAMYCVAFLRSKNRLLQ